MHLAFTDEQIELRQTVRRLLEERSAEDDVREAMSTETAFDADLWRGMATLGLAGLVVPEQYGGAGSTFVELGIVAEEAGRSLACVPLLSTVGLAANAILASRDTEAMETYLPRIAAGELVATLAFAEDEGAWDPSRIATTARETGDGWRLEGHKMFVTDGALADLVLVLALVDGDLSLFAVEPDEAAPGRETLRTLDPTRRQARLELRDVPAEPIGQPGDGERILSDTLDLAAVLIAAEATGGAQRVLEMAVDYAKQRVQFGRQIGSFQAIKHLCADVLVAVESAKSAAYHAMWAAAHDPFELRTAAPMAKAFCTEAYVDACKQNIQIHGGIGFTWEHPAHLYLKRAKTLELLFGDARAHRRLLLTRRPDSAAPAAAVGG